MVARVARKSRLTPELRRFLEAARLAGCPPDQVRRFRVAGYAPQPKQLAFHAACRTCDAPGGPSQVGTGGARGGGKSHALMMQVAADDCQRHPALKCLLLRMVGKAVRESFEDFRSRTLFALPHQYNRVEGVLTFENGSQIFLGHFKDERDIDAYLGLEYDVIGVEEATTLTAAKYVAIRTCCRTSKEDWRPRLYSTTNPGGVGHQWYRKTFILPFGMRTETETRFVPATVDDNRFVNADYTRTLDELTGWLRRAWRFGDWDISAGQFFTTWSREVHVVKGFGLPLDWTAWVAVDHGFAHWMVALLLARDGDGKFYVVDEYAARGALVPTNAAGVLAMVERNGRQVDGVRVVAGADVFARTGAAGLSIAQQYLEEGIHLETANMDRVNGAARVLGLLGDVERGIGPRLFMFERCGRVIECMPQMQHDPHRPEDVLKVDCDDEGVGGDDGYDALRYGVMEVGEMGRAYVGEY